MDAAQQNVQYHNAVACGNVRAVIILADPGTGQREKSPPPPRQTAPGKMTESCMNILPSSRWNRTHGPPSSNPDALIPELLEALWRAGGKFN